MRVAVETSQRRFDFDFEIIDEIGENYKFISQAQKRAIMTINGSKREINHKDLQKLSALHDKNLFKTEKDIIKFKKRYALKNKK